MNRLIAKFLCLACAFCLPGFAVADVVDIDNRTLKALIEEGVPVVDLRRADEWENTGVIDGSHLMTFFDKAGRYDAEKWKSELFSKIDRHEPVVLICYSGARTSIVGKWLSREMDTVYNVEAGIVSWVEDGNATVPLGSKP